MLDKPEHNPNLCLGCTINAYIVRKYGESGMQNIEQYQDFLDDMANITARVIFNIGPNAVPNYLKWLLDSLSDCTREASRPTEH